VSSNIALGRWRREKGGSTLNPGLRRIKPI
jgi:hypothetical protein